MKVACLSGGVGGARLLDGLQAALPPGALTAIVNVGDDLEHWGLHVSPDVDTVVYTLSGLADEARGWGLRDESFAALESMKRLGGEGWFALGDRDLAMHLRRTQLLREGRPLSQITAGFARALGIATHILPMSDGVCRTLIECEQGTLPFQEWFVQHRAPPVKRVIFSGKPPPAPGVLDALASAELVIIGPSNPYVSIDPILSLDGVREAILTRAIAVSPIVGGRAVKGPLAEMIPSLSGKPPSAQAIVDHYGALVRGVVLEDGDIVEGVASFSTRTVMQSRDDRRRLAVEILERFA